MRFSGEGIVRCAALGVLTGALVACGGGGGGGGGGGLPGGPTPSNEYEISLRSDLTQLPLNIAGAPAGVGLSSPYTTTLYVSARRRNSGDPIPGGEDVFGCNLDGLDVGALYYLDGDSEHADNDGVPLPFRSVTLGSNAGAASFHFHARNNAGTAVVTCSVTDPQSGRQVSTSLSITVGQRTDRPSQVRVNAVAPEFLFAQNTNGPTQLLIQAEVLDDAGQRVSDPVAGVINVFARIVPTPGAADDTARLRGTGGDNTWVAVRSVNGQAQFALVSGLATGTVLLEVLADRSDNDIGNGIALPVGNQISVPVVAAVAQEALTILQPGALPAARERNSYAALLSAGGGVPPYSWSLVAGSRLPSGLQLSAGGVITGTPAVSGPFSFAVQARDSSTLAQATQAVYSISITEAPAPEPTAPQVTTAILSAAQAGQPYLAVVSATGGTGVFTWSFAGLPAGLSGNSATGVISGIPAGPAGTVSVAVTVTSGGFSSTRVLSLTIS